MTDARYTLGTDEHREFLREQTRSLIDFGKNAAWPGGGASYLHDDGSPWPWYGLHAYESARFAHSYAMASSIRKHTDPSSMRGTDVTADQCLALSSKFLQAFTTGQLRDKHYGGWYTSVDREGQYELGKACYAHAFVLLGASSAMVAGVQEASALLNHALDIFDRYFWDASENMPRDTWDTSFTVCDDYRGINASMHTVEAYLAVSDCLGTPLYRERAGHIIRRVISYAEKLQWRIPEHFTSNWVPDLEYNASKKEDQFKPYGSTPGHGLEWARLIAQWALRSSQLGEISNVEKQASLRAAEYLFNRAMSDGWNADGKPGFVYTVNWDGTPIVSDRMQWTLAEGINTSALLYIITGDDEYAQLYSMMWKYADEQVIDHKLGNWYHQLDGDGRVLDSVWPGKPDIYHALQATLIPLLDEEHLGISIASAVAQGAV